MLLRDDEWRNGESEMIFRRLREVSTGAGRSQRRQSPEVHRERRHRKLLNNEATTLGFVQYEHVPARVRDAVRRLEAGVALGRVGVGGVLCAVHGVRAERGWRISV